jgi:precorrin-6A synthase
MRKVLIVGIGAGNPDHMTVQAIRALNEADVLFIPTKGEEKAELADLRRTICDRFVTRPDSRRVEFPQKHLRVHHANSGTFYSRRALTKC